MIDEKDFRVAECITEFGSSFFIEQKSDGLLRILLKMISCYPLSSWGKYWHRVGSVCCLDYRFSPDIVGFDGACMNGYTTLKRAQAAIRQYVLERNGHEAKKVVIHE